MESKWYTDTGQLLEGMKLRPVEFEGSIILTTEDGNTVSVSKDTWATWKDKMKLISEEEGIKASRKLIKMLKVKLYMELISFDHKNGIEKDITGLLHHDDDVKDVIKGR